MPSVPCLPETCQEQLTQLARALYNIYSSNISITTNGLNMIIFHLPRPSDQGDQNNDVFEKMQDLLSALSQGEQGSITWKDLQVVSHDRQVLHVIYKVDGRTKRDIIRSALTQDTHYTIELCDSALQVERTQRESLDLFLLEDD
jgi:hypothetical protein